MAAADYINYSIRPNKTVERKLLFEILTTLSPIFNFPGYRYVGFGSLWFVDFVMAHKYLSITDMISIEKVPDIGIRAGFNAPYRCIKVEGGESEDVLPTLNLEELPLVVWLDYEDSLNGSVLTDLDVLCQRAQTGSVLITTLNAHRKTLAQEVLGEEFSVSLENALREYAGDLVAAQIPAQSLQTTGFPPFLSSVIFLQLRRALRKAGRTKDKILPIFNVGYNDNAPMITVGAAIVDQAREQAATARLEDRNMGDFVDETEHRVIRVPPLTFKEKMSLDSLMPCDEPPTQADIENLGFRLKPSNIEGYHRYYRYYPIFGELAI